MFSSLKCDHLDHYKKDLDEGNERHLRGDNLALNKKTEMKIKN